MVCCHRDLGGAPRGRGPGRRTLSGARLDRGADRPLLRHRPQKCGFVVWLFSPHRAPAAPAMLSSFAVCASLRTGKTSSAERRIALPYSFSFSAQSTESTWCGLGVSAEGTAGWTWSSRPSRGASSTASGASGPPWCAHACCADTHAAALVGFGCDRSQLSAVVLTKAVFFPSFRRAAAAPGRPPGPPRRRAHPRLLQLPRRRRVASQLSDAGVLRGQRAGLLRAAARLPQKPLQLGGQADRREDVRRAQREARAGRGASAARVRDAAQCAPGPGAWGRRTTHHGLLLRFRFLLLLAEIACWC